ncbi:MAG: hypothetical protein ACO1TE_12310 [Prosthecobacter sp.]
MKGVADIFISKEKLAQFWFLVACACLAGTAWYLYDLAVTSRGSMLYVPVEKTFVYLDRSLKQQELDELVDYHARLAMETFLNRGPRGPLTMERLPLLFSEDGKEQAFKDIQDTGYDFRERHVHQLMEVAQVQIQHFPNGAALTLVKGQLVRVSQDPTTKEGMTQSFQVTADLTWIRNPSLRDARRFPFICNSIEYTLKPFSSSEDSTR